ncbi:MAG: hypothetical protein M0P76_05415 [Candidatus Pacebacteria bacterium]|jgi:hypothetical protein|nr:hypothetical protein [Candidatus Paceibacterota bacterium]
MEYRKKLGVIVIWSFLFASFLFIVFGEPFGEQTKKWCEKLSYCGTALEVVIMPVFLFSVAVFLISGILYFLRDEVFCVWLHFAKWYIPCSFMAIFLSLDSSRGDWLNPFETEFLTWALATLFFFISLILIAVKSWKLKGK